MRDSLILLSATILAGGLTLGTAAAQSRPGWVDPPAKADPGAKVEPATKAEAGNGDPAKPATATDPSAAQSRPAGQPARTAAPAGEPAASGSERPSVAAAPTGVKATESKAAETTSLRKRPQPDRESREAGRKAQTRLALTPRPAPGVDDPRFPDWAGRAQRLTLDYLDSISAPNATSLAAAPRFYAPRVRRFGKTETLAAVIAEKRRFAQRWPERRYAAQPGAIRTSCNAAVMACIVRATFDYRAQNSARGARSQGVAELVLEISFADDRPVIVSESSRVLRRTTSATLVDGRTKPGA